MTKVESIQSEVENMFQSVSFLEDTVKDLVTDIINYSESDNVSQSDLKDLDEMYLVLDLVKINLSYIRGLEQ